MFALAVILGGVLAAGPAMAQPPGAAQDSSLTNQVFSILRPSYATTYTIDRQTTIWDQSFDFGTGLGFMNFNNQTKFQVRRDSDRDEDRRDGRNTTDLRWFLIPNIPLHMNVQLGRRSTERPLNVNETNEAGISLSARYKWDLLGLSHTVDVGGGTDSNTGLTVRGDSRSESDETAVNRSLYWKSEWDPFEYLSTEGSIRDTRSDKNSVLTEEGVTQDLPTSTWNRILDAKVSFDPTDWFQGNFNATQTDGDDEYFLLQGGIGQLEQSVKKKSALTANFLYEPNRNTDITWRVASNTHTLDYRVRAEISSAGSGDAWEGTIKTRWMGADIQSKLNHGKDTLEPAIGDTTDTETASFDGKISKKLSQKFAVQFDWLVRAQQIFYQNFEVRDRLDKDELRTKIQPTLTYTPGNRWTANLTYIRTVTRRIELNPDRAAQTREDEDYTVNIGFTYTLSQKTHLSQSYSIKALYTTFDFNESSNSLLATQRITTNISSQVTPKVLLEMGHRFTLQDSGPFTLRDDGSRLFARSQRKYRQELTSRIEYAITPWLKLNANSRFLRTDDVAEATGARRIFRDLQLQEGFSLAQSLAGGVVVTASGAYVRSNTRDSYLTLQSSLTKDF